MKRILFMAAVFMLWNLPARAVEDDGPNREARFAKMKEMRIEGIQQRISILEDALKCLQAATDRNEMRVCNDKEREARREYREGMRSKWEAQKPGQKPAEEPADKPKE